MLIYNKQFMDCTFSRITESSRYWEQNISLLRKT